LEGLRGLASVVVVARHSLNAVQMPLPLRRALLEGPLAPLLNAQGAVQLFFVLSGYVLALSLSRHTGRLATGQFLVRRVFRIYPPYIAAVLGAWALCAVSASRGLRPGYTRWLDVLAVPTPDAGPVLESLWFPGLGAGLLAVGWTLEIEMVFSLLLPVLLWFAVRSHALVLIAVAILALVVEGVPTVLRFAIDFALGISLFLERERIAGWMKPVRGWLGLAVFIVAVALFAAPELLGWHLADLDILVPLHLAPASIAWMAVGSAGLIALAIHLPLWRRILSSTAFAYAGRVSFSLYLVHVPVLIVCARWIGSPTGIAGWLLLFGIVMAISLPLASLAHRWVELPSIALGNALCRRVARLRE